MTGSIAVSVTQPTSIAHFTGTVVSGISASMLVILIAITSISVAQTSTTTIVAVTAGIAMTIAHGIIHANIHIDRDVTMAECATDSTTDNLDADKD